MLQLKTEMAAQAQEESPEEKVLFAWQVPARPFKKRNKEFFITVGLIGFLIALILFFIEGVLPVAVVLSIVFLVYVLATISPEEVEHKITNKGVVFAGKTYLWRELVRFWFTQRFGSNLLVLETIKIPGRLELVINAENKLTIQKALVRHLPFEEAPPNFLDRAASWFGKKVPFDK